MIIQILGFRNKEELRIFVQVSCQRGEKKWYLPFPNRSSRIGKKKGRIGTNFFLNDLIFTKQMSADKKKKLKNH